jgi:hypothetical protein
MRVRCTHIVEISGADRGRRLDHHPLISVGDEFVVIAMTIDPDRGRPWVTSLQVHEEGSSPSWWSGEMFETISSTAPRNWIVQLWADGSLHIAPAPWLERGFWEEYFDHQRGGQAAETFRRELQIILDES